MAARSHGVYKLWPVSLWPQIVVAYVRMADQSTHCSEIHFPTELHSYGPCAYMVMACTVMASIIVAFLCMACMFMAYIVMVVCGYGGI